MKASPAYDLGPVEETYQQLVADLYGNQSRVIRTSLVRRIGHFEGRPQNNTPQCRRFSFMLEGCHEALLEKIDDWWDDNVQNVVAIVYDTDSNPWYEPTILAFAERRKLRAYSAGPLLSKKRDGADQLVGAKCALFVDVVHTGETLLRRIRELRKRGIAVCSQVLAAISDGELREIEQDGDRFLVTSLAQGVQESIAKSRCVQCKLNIPYASDVEDKPDHHLSSYDFWWMTERVGWEAEPREEVPEHGHSYEIIPRFPEMLERFGDWFAQKMELRLSIGKRPASFFLIHPDEAGSNGLSEKLRLRYQKEIAVVAIPRVAISDAVARHDWSEVLRSSDGKMWVKHLEALKRSPDVTDGIILDIFNGSGSTFAALYSLLKTYELTPFCYFPFVDRDLGSNPERYPIPKHCLYEWYGPRELKVRAEGVSSK